MNNQTMPPAGWLAIGVALGGGLGVALDNGILGVGAGICLGAAMMAYQRRLDERADHSGGEPHETDLTPDPDARSDRSMPS
jgi:hypothetical protein